MDEVSSLIAAFHEINSSPDKTVAHFTPSLVGMFGSIGIFDSFLAEIDAALASKKVSSPLKKRAANLTGTFIPQVAEYNRINNLKDQAVTAADLKGISAGTLANRLEGAVIILSALTAILKEVNRME